MSRIVSSAGIAVAALSLMACAGARDSLLLTGLRDKPDEYAVTVNQPLVIPQDDRLLSPGTLSEGSVTRTHAYEVNSILFDQDTANGIVGRQLRPAPITPAEAHLRQIANRAGTASATTAPVASPVPWWLRPFRRNR